MISHYIAENIDRILLDPNFVDRALAAIPYEHMLLVPLITRNIPSQILDHLKFDFVHRKKEIETKIENENLSEIHEILTEEFGFEVVRRINISLSPDKQRNC